MKKKMKKWLSCMMAAAMVMSTVNLPTDILASDFVDGVEISVEDENEDAPEVVVDGEEDVIEDSTVLDEVIDDISSENGDEQLFSDHVDEDIDAVVDDGDSAYAVGTSEAEAIVNVAKGEVGVSGRPNKYTRWYGKINDSYSYEWCHAFVSWCADQAGVADKVPKTAACRTGVTWFKNKGQWKARSSGYIPSAGDIIYFDFNSDGTSDHVGIVTGSSNGRVYTIEGNAKDAVKVNGGYSNGYATNSSNILGYGVSAYSSTNPEPIENPSISGTYWGSATDSTFRPVISISNPETVQNVRFAVWTTGDQSDLKWYDARFNGVKEYFQDINFSDFGNKIYICHVYVYGKNGSTQSVEMDRLDMNDYPQPDISGTYWGSITDSTFRPVVSISNPEAVQNVRFAVWTTGDQSDLSWYDARFNGVKEYFQDINFSDFNNKKYICHVYVYGKNGSTQSVEMDRLDLNNYPKPDIKGVYWGSTTDSTFRPVVVITNPESIENVRFAIWTTSDQRDLQWYDANYNGLNEYFKDVEYSDFETQHYFCHVYVYGKDGSTQSVALNDFDTYSAEGNFENATGGVGCVTVSGYAFDRSNIQENIVVHCYLKDSEGTATFLGEIKADQEREDVNNKYSVRGNHGFEHAFTTALIGTYTVEVSAMNIGGGNDVTFLGAKEITITQPTIFFDCCGGTECEPIKVINTQNYGSLPVTTRTGYMFDGWYTEKEGGQRVTEDDTVNVTSDQTLFAHWTKCEHKDVEIRDRKEATCTTEGYSGDKYCSVCGQVVEKGETIPKLNHTWDNGKVTREATCTTEGEKIYTCTSCQETKTESIAKTGHTEVKDAAVAATCESEGKTEGSHCNVCGAVIKAQESIPATGHTWDNGKVTKEATCTETGEKTYTCTICQKTRTESITKTGHTEVKDAAVAATCESEGKTEGSHCSVCNIIIKKQETIPVTGHSWDNGKVTKAATCTEEGEKTYTCTTCQKTRTESIAKTGHTEVKDAAIAATCESEGRTEGSHCSVCGTIIKAQESIPATGHSWDNGKVTKEATCTETGEKTYTCTTCQKTRTESTTKTGHTEVKDAAVAATCESEGKTEGSHCSVCNTVIKKQEIIPAAGHTWNNGKITKEATCTENGEKIYTCTTCQKTKTEVLASTGHSKITKFVKNATCETEGYTGDIYCNNCGEMLREGKIIEKLSHDWKQTGTKKVTCTVKGEKIYTCNRCKKTKIEQIPATGHKWSSWKKVSDATVLQKEKQKRTCSECGTSQSREYGNKLKSVMKVNYSGLLLKTKQSTSILTVSGMAKGDYVSKVQSGNNGIVKVTKYTKDGKIQLTAQGKTGSTKVTIRLAGGAVKQINVKVQKGTVKTTSVKVSPSKVTLKKGAKKTISVTISPATSQEKVTYTSSNKNIATVSTKGVITAKKQGTAKITVKSGSKKQIITVTVK